MITVASAQQPNQGPFQFVEGALKLRGQIGGSVEREKVRKGSDALGKYGEISVNLGRGHEALVRDYIADGVVVFDLTYTKAEAGNGIEFPEMTDGSTDCHTFSFRDTNFAKPTFSFTQTCTPELLFDSDGHAAIFSPASNFMVSTLEGDQNSFGSGLNKQLESIPAGFHQKSVLVLADTIHEAWAKFGRAMQFLFGKQTPKNDADVILNKFGYWTDNGADYYYDYEPNLGYEGTLLSVRKRYAEEGIPLGYMQLDSWWYSKSIDDATGKAGGSIKNANLPPGDWNRYGGTMIYRASPDLFPYGLAGFQTQLGLPLAVHNRWIDRNSPYHARFQFSGVGAVDPMWWLQTMDYLSKSGVVCYEQDWLDHIYNDSPDMARTAAVGDEFANGMANACRVKGLDMQYCMATPRFFLQGLEYPNLTTIRTSDDRFDRDKWHDFLYVSQLARAVGIWPWCDVFMSGEKGNMILSVLSGGPVGTGDKLGKEDKSEILKAVRLDGVIVKPDESLLPIDQTYLDQASGSANPFVASTYTGSGAAKTVYLFAFERKPGIDAAILPLRQCGISSRCYLYRPSTDEGRYVSPDDQVQEQLGGDGYVYLEAAPVLAGGIVILGDLDQIVPTGRKRMLVASNSGTQVKVSVSFAAGEDSVEITGLALKKPNIDGAILKSYDQASGRFVVSCESNGAGSLEFTVAI